MEGYGGKARARLTREADERLHQRYRADRAAFPQYFHAHLRRADMLGDNFIPADHAFQHLQGRVVGAGVFVYPYRNSREIARDLQRIVKREDRLGGHGSAQGGDASAARSTLDPVDPSPLAKIEGIGRATLVERLFQPGQYLTFSERLIPILVSRRITHFDSHFIEEAFFETHQNGKIEGRRIWCDSHKRPVFLRHFFTSGKG